MRAIICALIYTSTVLASPMLFPTVGPYELVGTLDGDGLVILEESMREEKIPFNEKSKKDWKQARRVHACVLLKKACTEDCKIERLEVIKPALPWDRQVPKDATFGKKMTCSFKSEDLGL